MPAELCGDKKRRPFDESEMNKNPLRVEFPNESIKYLVSCLIKVFMIDIQHLRYELFYKLIFYELL